MPTLQEANVADYAACLDLYGMSYRPAGFYYQVGEIGASQGWILHISVIAHLAEGMFHTILPLLAPCPFKIIRDKKNLHYLNAGYQGFNRIGKVICVYPETEEDALLLVERLLPALKTYKGPTIITDFHLGAVLYTRYGSFKSDNLNFSSGDPNAVILDGHGRAFQDQYFIPPRTPEGMRNPFTRYLTPAKYSRTPNVLHNKYWIQQVLSTAVKGNVLVTATRNGRSFRKCIVKQGRENMISDDAGRDMKDRIRWQFAVHRDLQKDIAIPEAYEYFEMEGDGFMSMELIRGTSLNQVIFETYGNSLWPFLSAGSKKDLLTYVSQILVAIQRLHGRGYIHRDITSNNFIVTRKKKVYLIDLELTYSFKNNLPAPPFEAATIGYASPEHMALKMPTIQDDIYSIGALLITLFTGFEPMFIIEPDMEHLATKLRFLTGDGEITSLIIQCLDPVPAGRPALEDIISTINSIKDRPGKSTASIFAGIERPDPGAAQRIIQRGLNGLGESYMLSEAGLWISGSAGYAQLQTDAMIVRDVFPDIYQGGGGILYMLSKARSCGFDLTNMINAVQKNWTYNEELQYSGLLDRLPGGLYFGKAGIAVMMAAVKENELLDIHSYDPVKLREWFSVPEEDPGVLHGIAGQGIGLLRCRDYVENYREIADHYMALLILLQQKDGAWVTKDAQGKLGKNTGFGYGIAGIIYFLLEYYRLFGVENAWKGACQGLAYLEKKVIKTKDKYQWANSDTDETLGGWWGIGTPGIALTFLKAFQVTGENKYKIIAEKALDFHPAVFVHYNLSQHQGLSGLGEIYLEAASILNDDKYRQKADWIAGVLMRLTMNAGNDSSLWCVENNYYAVPGLMTGNSGILHFLMRNSFPDKIVFPVLGGICPDALCQ